MQDADDMANGVDGYCCKKFAEHVKLGLFEYDDSWFFMSKWGRRTHKECPFCGVKL